MLIIYGLFAIADQQHQRCCAEEEDNGKVEVMDPTHQVRAAGGENTAASTKPELGQHPTQTHPQTTNQAPEGTLQVTEMWFHLVFHHCNLHHSVHVGR